MKAFTLVAIAATASAVELEWWDPVTPPANQFETTSGNQDPTGTYTTAPDHRHDVWLRLGEWAEEVKFELFGPTYCAGGPYDLWHEEVETNCSLVPGRYVLKCEDTYGDGWHDGYIVIGGTKYCHDFLNGHEKLVEIQIHDVPNKAGTQSGGGDQVAKVTGWGNEGHNNN